jgi:NADPH:quinone reductase-like Zn-dependent oxidoreductase
VFEIRDVPAPPVPRDDEVLARVHASTVCFGGKDHGAAATMSLVHDVKEHIGSVGTVGEVAHFVDHQHGGVRVGRECLRELPGAKRTGQVVGEGRCLPLTMSERPSVTKSAASADPSIVSRKVV